MFEDSGNKHGSMPKTFTAWKNKWETLILDRAKLISLYISLCTSDHP